MWTAFLVVSLVVGLAALGWGVFADPKGFVGIGNFAVFVAGWLPATSLASVAILVAASARAGWRWTFVAGVVVLLGCVEIALLAVLGNERWPYCFMPLVLVSLASVALLRRSSEAPLAAPVWMQQSGAWIAAGGLVVMLGAYGLRARESRRRSAEQEAYRAAEIDKDAQAHGMDRAAWLLGQEFSSQEGFSEAEFIRSRVYRAPRSGAVYRWDEERRKLSVTQPLFCELSFVRPEVLPAAERALASEALRPGPREEFGGGVLRCAPPLECTLAWEFDAETLRPGARALRGALETWVNALELRVRKELFPER